MMKLLLLLLLLLLILLLLLLLYGPIVYIFSLYTYTVTQHERDTSFLLQDLVRPCSSLVV